MPLVIALERGGGQISVFSTECFDEGSSSAPLNLPYAERLVKFLLWQRGGWRVIVGGPKSVGEHIKQVYSAGGARAFDFDFMGDVYEHPFTVEVTDAGQGPRAAARARCRSAATWTAAGSASTSARATARSPP